jgi:hypothetical protein
LIIENGTFSQTTGAIWAWLLLEQFAGFYPILLCFKGVLKGFYTLLSHKWPFEIAKGYQLLISRSRSTSIIMLVSKVSSILVLKGPHF